MTLLLDANVLIAAVVVEHVHHEAAERALAAGAAFATCPITELALMRFLVREGTSAARAAAVLDAVTQHPHHRSWPADVPVTEVDWGAVQGHRQVTDAYLAALARANGGRLMTLDRGLAAAHPDVADFIDAR